MILWLRFNLRHRRWRVTSSYSKLMIKRHRDSIVTHTFSKRVGERVAWSSRGWFSEQETKCSNTRGARIPRMVAQFLRTAALNESIHMKSIKFSYSTKGTLFKGVVTRISRTFLYCCDWHKNKEVWKLCYAQISGHTYLL